MNKFKLILFWGWVLSAFLTAGIRCWYGFDGLDEALYIAHGFKSFAMGDLIFKHEILSGPKQHDLLNYLFIRPLVPYSILAIRLSALAAYGVILLLVTFRFFRDSLGFFSGLLYFVCLTFDSYLMPTWSYNWWLRDLLLIHVLMLSLALKSQRAFYYFLAGASLGLSVIVYNPMLIGFGVALMGAALLCGVVSPFLKSGIFLKWRQVAIYLAGAAFFFSLDALYIFKKGLWPYLIKAYTAVYQERFNQTATPQKKLGSVIADILLHKELYFFAAVLFVVVGFPYIRNLSQKKKPLHWALLWGLTVGFFVWKTGLFFNIDFFAINLYLPLAVLAGLGLVWFSFCHRESQHAFFGIVGLAAILAMSLSSVNSTLISFFVFPSLLIPFFGRYQKWQISSHLPQAHRRFAYANFSLAFIYLAVISFTHQYSGVYRDFSPQKMTKRFSMVPLKGIWTNARRAESYERLYNLVRNKKYVLAFDTLPQTFLFGDVRSSIDTVQIDSVFSSDQRNLNSLRFMVSENRTPQLIIKAHKHPWAWGGDPYFKIPYPFAHPLTEFTLCVQTTEVLSTEEFSAYEIDEKKIPECLEKISATQIASPS